MKKKNFIFLLFLVVLCLLGITSFNSVKLNALTNVPTNSFIGEKQILPFYSDENEFIEYGLAYNSYNQTNYFIGTYFNKNQGFSYPNNAYYFWMYNFDLINSGGGDTPPVDEIQSFNLVLDSVIQATFNFVVGISWIEWIETDYNTSDVITYNSDEGAFYFNTDYIILNITANSLILNQDYEIVLVETPTDVPTDLIGYTVTVPSGWSASSGYGVFVLLGTMNGDSNKFFTRFCIGYSSSFDLSPEGGIVTTAINNFVSTYDASDLGGSSISNLENSSFSFVVSFGSDSTNQLLIQWLVDNNATFTLTTNTQNLSTLSNVVTLSFNDFSNEELISYFKTCINWDFSILQRVITGIATLYLNVNGLWFSCNYNPTALNDNVMYLNITYNPSLPTSTKDNYNYGIGELTPYILNAYNNYELRNNVEEELKEQQAYYESLLEQERQNAMNEGYLNGESYGYNQGYNAGYNTGYSEGIQEGSDGEFTLRNLLGTIFTFPISLIKNGMDVELWGVNIGGLIMFILCIGLVYIIIKLVLKFFGR